MDKQQITRQLHRLAEEEIPETMNLWPRIQGQLKRKAKPRSFSLAYGLSAFVMLMLVGIGAYVAYRSPSNTAEEAVSPNLATDLGMIQTIGGITVSLDWAYADANIISVQYSIIFNPQEVTLPDFSVVTLRTADGLLLPQDFNGGGGGGGGDETQVRFTNQANFSAENFVGNSETIDLVLLIQHTETYQNYEIQFQPTVPPYPTGLNEPKGDIFTATPIVMGILSSPDPINVRTGPATVYEIVMALPAGASIQVLGQNAEGTWYNIRLADGTEGWISSQLIRLEPTSTPMPFGMGTPVVDSSSLTARSDIATSTAIVQATEMPPDSDPFSLTATSIIATATAMAQPSQMPPTALPPNMEIQPSLIPPMQFTPTPVPPANIFAFSFTVPFYPAKTGEVIATNYGSNEITAVVQNLRITPAMTKFEICYTAPDDSAIWYPKVSLDTGFAVAPILNSAMTVTGLDGQTLYPAQNFLDEGRTNNRQCMLMHSYAPSSPDADTMDIQLEYLYTQADFANPTTWAADEAFFAERGFDLSYAYVPIAAGDEQDFYSEPRPSNIIVYPLPEAGALLITLRDYPDSLEEYQAQQYIFDNMLKERVLGNWNFHVVVD